MTYKYYNPSDEKGSCILRAISKAFNKNYNYVKDEILSLAKDLNYDDYKQEEVFEKYLFDNGFTLLKGYEEIKIKDLDLKNGIYVIFCYKDDFYHMVTVIDNVLYDNRDVSLDLKVIKIYKVDKKI